MEVFAISLGSEFNLLGLAMVDSMLTLDLDMWTRIIPATRLRG